MILCFRFLYGLRTVASFVIGMSSASAKKFILPNASGALVWAVAVASSGYLFGQALEVFIGMLKSQEIYIMGSVAIVGIFIWVFHFTVVANGRLGLSQKVDDLLQLTVKQISKTK